MRTAAEAALYITVCTLTTGPNATIQQHNKSACHATGMHLNNHSTKKLHCNHWRHNEKLTA